MYQLDDKEYKKICGDLIIEKGITKPGLLTDKPQISNALQEAKDRAIKVEIMRERYANAQNIWTGQPLAGRDLEEWKKQQELDKYEVTKKRPNGKKRT